MPLQIRRGTQAERLVMTTPLAQGELLYVTDDQRLYIGNGSTLGGVPITGYTNEDAMDAAAGMLTSGVHTGITFTYGTTQDAAGRIDAAIDFSSYSGAISADLHGSVFSDTSTRLIDGTEGKFNLDGTVGGHIIPDDSETYDLGSGSYRFRDLWLSGSSIHLGNALITSTGSAVNLPAGSTINGVVIGTGSSTGDGVIEGSSYRINIVSSDASTIMLNNDAETVTASGGFFGDVTGNVFGNLQGNLYASDFTLLVDGTGKSFAGGLTGDVLGNVTGDLTGSVIAADTSTIVNGTDRSVTASTVTVETSILGASSEIDIGSVSAGLKLNIFSKSNDTAVSITAIANGPQQGAAIEFAGSRGSYGTPTAVQAGDALGTVTMFGHNGTSHVLSSLVASIADPSGSFTGGKVPGKLLLTTFEDNNPVNATVVTVNRFGMVQIGYTYTDDAVSHLDINGAMLLAPQASAPAVPTPGMLVIADGTGWNPTSTGKNTLLCYLGSAWVQVAVAA